ncbi:MAG: hypothetical protein ACNA76_06800 [Anaerosomatales bacterium]|nr:hypothetical protein [Coriobacteriia bacterium]
MYSQEYVVARRALLDALEALQGHRDALVLVGAQAIYLHTGAAQFAVAEFTTDGDVAIDPRLLSGDPEIASAMRKAKFFLDMRDGRELVGVWASMREIAGVPAKVTVDLLVPDALGGAGRRAARVPQHEKGSMLKVHGLEAALVDNSVMSIGSLEATDARSFTMKVAGPTALLISKTIKLSERVTAGALERGRPDRVKPKDALDVLRLLQAIPSAQLAEGFAGLLVDETAGPVTSEALGRLPGLFGDADSPGSQLAAEAAAPEPSDVIAASCAALCRELLDALRAQGIDG